MSLRDDIYQTRTEGKTRPILERNTVTQQWQIEGRDGLGLILSREFDNNKLYLSVSPGSSPVKLTDVKPTINIMGSGLATVIIGRTNIKEISLTEINGENPVIYWNYCVINHSRGSPTLQELGHIYILYNSRILEVNIVNEIKTGNAELFLNEFKHLGYIITIPFDIITFPIQLAIGLYGFSKLKF